MKKLIQWTHAHPLKAIGLAVLLTMIVTFTATRDDLLPYGAALFGVITVITAVIVARDVKKMTLVVAALLVLAPCLQANEEPQANPVTTACVVVVIVVGGVVIYNLVKFCQKAFPPPPPPATNQLVYAASPASSAAANNQSSCGSCYEPTFVPVRREHPTTFEITGRVVFEEGRAKPVIEKADLATIQTNTLSWAEYASALQTHGITLLEHGQGEIFYGLNGRPASPEEVPISFIGNDAVVSNGAPLGTVTVERSTDLREWVPVLTTHLSEGYRFRILDTSLAGQAFYRVTTQ